MSVREEIIAILEEDFDGDWAELFEEIYEGKLRDYTAETIVSPEYEGGPASQEYIVKFSKPGQEDVLFQFPCEWVSWDGMYYDSLPDGMVEVEPVQVLTTVYRPKKTN